MNPDTSAVLKPRRGRPPKVDRQFDDTRQALIRSGLEVLTETGYLAAGIDAVIKNIAVPKGSFYHCFKSKEAFGLAVLAAYGDFFAHKLDKFLLDDAVPPLERMAAFVRHAGHGNCAACTGATCAKRSRGHRQRRLTAGAGPGVLDRLGRRGDARRAGPVCRTA